MNQFAYLKWYTFGPNAPHGYFYNWATHEPLREFNPPDEYQPWSIHSALQILTSEGWHIVYVEKRERQADNDYDIEVWFQRMGASE